MTDLTARQAELAENLARVEERIEGACVAAGRSRDEVTLIVVTKTYPARDVRLLSELGVRHVRKINGRRLECNFREVTVVPVSIDLVSGLRRAAAGRGITGSVENHVVVDNASHNAHPKNGMLSLNLLLQ